MPETGRQETLGFGELPGMILRRFQRVFQRFGRVLGEPRGAGAPGFPQFSLAAAVSPKQTRM